MAPACSIPGSPGFQRCWLTPTWSETREIWLVPGNWRRRNDIGQWSAEVHRLNIKHASLLQQLRKGASLCPAWASWQHPAFGVKAASLRPERQQDRDGLAFVEDPDHASSLHFVEAELSRVAPWAPSQTPQPGSAHACMHAHMHVPRCPQCAKLPS